MIARGWACLHTTCPERGRRAHLPVPKTPTAKPCVSISSKLIENTRLQVLYSGHLRKTGGWGSYQLVHIKIYAIRKSPSLTPAFTTLARPLTNPTIFNNVQTIGGRVVWSYRSSVRNRPASEGSRYTNQEAAAWAAGWPRRSIRGAKGAHKSQRYIGELG